MVNRSVARSQGAEALEMLGSHETHGGNELCASTLNLIFHRHREFARRNVFPIEAVRRPRQGSKELSEVSKFLKQLRRT